MQRNNTFIDVAKYYFVCMYVCGVYTQNIYAMYDMQVNLQTRMRV